MTSAASFPAATGVVGGGRRGAGIAHAFLLAGCQVVLVEMDERRVEGARSRVLDAVGASSRRGDLTTSVEDVEGRLTVTTLVDRLAACDLVVEAVPEDLGLKAEVLTPVEAVLAPDAPIATNTSSLPVSRMASSLTRPHRLLGLHFFNPVPASLLVEVVVGEATSPDLVEKAQRWVTTLGKTPVVVRDSPGFASSRLGLALGLEAIRMLEEGVASAEDIDTAMVLGYRHPVGPLRLTDLVGLDVRLDIARGTWRPPWVPGSSHPPSWWPRWRTASSGARAAEASPCGRPERHRCARGGWSTTVALPANLLQTHVAETRARRTSSGRTHMTAPTTTQTGTAPEPTGPTSPIDYSQRIPNNVDLANDRRLQRALEGWQPKFLDWWKQLGPAVPTQDVYLRTATAVGRDGWAHFDRVPMEEYRWGIFLAERDPERRVAFGSHKGELAWQTVPGEYRAELMRLITIQGDTEPASVEQQRLLGATAPSLYDMRNLFQVNVEEGRHLWAMVYLLHAYFGREGREEAEQLLKRNSGDPDAPRILGAFNEETTDWLQFFMFTYFTDRDGKYQLGTLKESAFDPLARTCEFMLKEEAHHMFVGTTGVQRVVQRTAQLMVEHGTDDVFPHGGIPLDVIQKYLNFQFAVSMDLFGSEQSTNAGNYFTSGLKGRWQETRRKDDHVLLGQTREMTVVEDGAYVTKTVPMLSALNLDLRDEYVADCENGVRRWNQALEDAGLSQRLTLPHEGFFRKVGAYAGKGITPEGEIIGAEQFESRQAEWVPSPQDREQVAALMVPEYTDGRFAGWIAPPSQGINEMPVEYDYVRFPD